METIKLKKYDTAVKVELNDDGDFIYLTADSATFFDNYVTFLKALSDLADETEKQVTKVQEEYKDDMDIEERIALSMKISQFNLTFSEKAKEMVDELLGEGVTYKYFKELYDNVKDFIPDAECFMDFIAQVNPVVEKLYGKKVEIRKNINKEKVAKYTPQDFKKKGAK